MSPGGCSEGGDLPQGLLQLSVHGALHSQVHGQALQEGLLCLAVLLQQHVCPALQVSHNLTLLVLETRCLECLCCGWLDARSKTCAFLRVAPPESGVDTRDTWIQLCQRIKVAVPVGGWQ